MNPISIEALQRQLADALKRIDELERKVETMRVNINANFDGHATVLARISEHAGIRGRFIFKTGADVARGDF